MSPGELLSAAKRMLDEPSVETEGVWARTCAVLTRQALEQAVAIKLSKHAGSLEDVNFRAQMLCVHGVTSDDAVAAKAYFVWSALSRALHHGGYELPPTAQMLRGWVALVEEVVDGLE